MKEHLCIFANGDFELEVNGDVILFEWSEVFGPTPITKRGYERKIGNRHPFWSAVSLWVKQGKRADGKAAIWHIPKPPVLKHLGGRQYFVVEPGEEGYELAKGLLAPHDHRSIRRPTA